VSFQVFVPGRLWTVSKERQINRFERADLVRDIREAAKFHTIAAMRRDKFAPFDVPVTVEFLPYQATGNLADTANHLPPCKAVLDGMVDAGLLVDDNPNWVISQTFYPPVKSKMIGVSVLVKVA
jgi:hypothetical protein